MKTLNRKLLKQVLIGVLIVGVLFLIFTKIALAHLSVQK